MKEKLHLLWDYNGWGVYGECTMPDPTGGVFPDYVYRTYEIPKEKVQETFRKLMRIKSELEKGGLIPNKENQSKIFPTLEDLLK